jgi:RNA polymerase primary sigma factor
MYNQDDLTIYMRDVRKTTLLTRDEEIDLSIRIQKGDKQAEEKLIMGNLRFVISIARQFQNVGIPFGDLINEGNYGLIKAAKRFNPNSGNKFISYAVWWIRQSILQCINDHSRMIRLPVNISNELLKLRKTIQDDICNANMYPKVVSWDDYVGSSGYTENFNQIKNGKSENPENLMVEKESLLSDALENSMSTLNIRERYIIDEYFLNEDETKTLEVIGAELNLTKERIRQIRDKALRKIRNNSVSLFAFLE